MKTIYQPLFDNNHPPGEIFFGHEVFVPNTTTPRHSHPWGQLQLINGGILELATDEKRFLSPSQYAVWVPAGIEHQSFMRRSLNYCSMNIVSPLADALPHHPCLLEVSPIMEAIVGDLKQRQVTIPESEQDIRLVKVLLDQVVAAKEHDQFLPSSDDKLLKPILQALDHDPAATQSIKEWAAQLHTTERTLARHCQDKLGMSFTEWRQRRKFIYSLHLLRKGLSVKEIAFSLGYNQASPFITLFKRHAQCTPEQYRQKFYPRTEQ